MQGFYNLSEKIRQTLQLDDFVNTVTYGDIYDVDLNKQTIFPLSHFMVNSATMQSNVWNFNISLLCMDIVDDSRTLQREYHKSLEETITNKMYSIHN